MRAFLLAFVLLLSAACRPQAAPALTEWLAGGYAERQFDLETAAEFYRRALEADPGNLTVQGRLLRTRIAAGDAGASLALARRMEEALAGGDADGEAALDGAMVALRLVADDMARGRWRAAAKRLEGPGSKALPGAVRRLALAWARHAAGDAGGAETALSETGKAGGAGGWAALHRALMHQAAGRMEEARSAFAAMREAGVGARGLLAEAAFQAQAGDVETARGPLQRYRLLGGLLDIEDPAGLAPLAPTPAAGVAEALYGAADAFHRRRVPMALIYARLAVMADPGHHAAMLLAGDILADRERYDEAAAAYRAVPADSIWRPVAERHRARAYAAEDRFDEAAALMEAEAAAHPQDPYPLGELGHLLRGEERWEEAAAAYGRAIARIEDRADALHWRLYYGRGIAFERSKQWELAEQDLLKALEFVPDQAYVLNYLGYSWVDRGERYERAEDMLARAVSLRPRDGYIADSLGWVYFRTGRYPEAVKELERAASLFPLESVVNEHLGDAYWKVGRRLEARFQWQRALDFDPEPERMEGLRRRLECGLDCE